MLRDLRSAVRWLFRNPLFACSVTAILALGIGANTAVFSVVDAVLLRSVPYQSAARLIRIEENSTQHVMNGVPAQDYLFWRSRAGLFDKTIPFMKDFVILTGAAEPDQIRIMRTDAGLFSLLGAGAQLGRTLNESDGQFNAQDAAVLSDRIWRSQFHADPHVVGRSVTISDEPVTVVGVMPPDFEFSSSDIDMWVPLRLTPASTANLQVLARMKPGLTVPQVQSAMSIAAQQLVEKDPKQLSGLQIEVSSWKETVERQYQLTLVFILVAVGLVLLIACADVASLLLSRAVQRQKEIAIRASLGAGNWRVLRQLLAESLVLALAGSAVGITTANYALQLLVKQLTALPIVIPHLQRVSLNERVLLFNAGLCLVLACVFSVAPALLASKTELQMVLRSGPASGGSRRSARLFSLLIASEAAFAFLLLVGSGLMIHSLIRLQQADHGFHPEHVLTLRVPLGTRTQPPRGQYESRPSQMAYYREIMNGIRDTPGVSAIAVVNNIPLSGANTSTAVVTPDGQTMLTVTRTISPQYFDVMGIPLIEGRIFSDADQATSAQVAIINQYLAHQLFPDRDPLGQSISESKSDDFKVTVVGVVKDSSQGSYDQPAKGEVYRPYQQFFFGAFLSTIVARTSGDPLVLAATLRKEVWQVDPNQPVVKVESMNDVVAQSIWRPRFSAWLLSILGGLALLLTSGGIYGVVAYTTALKTREVGIRVAIGATPRNVITAILRDSMLPLAAGLAVGLLVALLLSRLLAAILFETRGTDPLAYWSAGVLLMLIGVLASARPAWKAATGDPLEALRTE